LVFGIGYKTVKKIHNLYFKYSEIAWICFLVWIATRRDSCGSGKW